MGIFIEYFGLVDKSYSTIKDNPKFQKMNNKYILEFESEEFREIAEFVEKNEIQLTQLKIMDNGNVVLDIVSKHFNSKPVTFKNFKPIDYDGVISYSVEVIQASTKFQKSFKRP